MAPNMESSDARVKQGLERIFDSAQHDLASSLEKWSMGYGIDEKEKFLLERKLEELTQWSTDTSGRIGAYNPAASDTLDTRLLDRRKKAKTTTKPDPKKLKVKPVVECSSAFITKLSRSSYSFRNLTPER